MMKLQPLPYQLTVCKLPTPQELPPNLPFCFWARTDEEYSLVCPTDQTPLAATAREDGFRAFRIEGVLDFSLIGILAAITARLADAAIGIFAVSTFNTDYILVKEENYARALSVLAAAGYYVDIPSSMDKETSCV